MACTLVNTPTPLAQAFNNPRAMQPVLDLLVASTDEDLRAILVHGLVEHAMRGSHTARPGDERHDAIADVGTILSALRSYDSNGNQRAWLIDALLGAWTIPQDDTGLPSWALFTTSERNSLWAVGYDVLSDIRALPYTEGKVQSLCSVSQHVAKVVESMIATPLSTDTDTRKGSPTEESFGNPIGCDEAQLAILPLLFQCYNALHHGDIFRDNAVDLVEQFVVDAVDSLIRSGLVPPNSLAAVRMNK